MGTSVDPIIFDEERLRSTLSTLTVDEAQLGWDQDALDAPWDTPLQSADGRTQPLDLQDPLAMEDILRVLEVIGGLGKGTSFNYWFAADAPDERLRHLIVAMPPGISAIIPLSEISGVAESPTEAAVMLGRLVADRLNGTITHLNDRR